MESDPNCVFCRIVAGEAEASIVYRDEWVTAFMDIYPVNPGHILIIPNIHSSGLKDLPAESGAHMFHLAQRLAGHVRRIGVSADAVNLVLADGSAAGQTIFHTHLHVIPRYFGDGSSLRLHTSIPRQASRDQLDALAQSLRESLGGNSSPTTESSG